ncbi:MAG: cytochrome c family protein, partial [Pirellulales bacterium]|nr:cytochrome c family protein [Pirellulales bacterium]
MAAAFCGTVLQATEPNRQAQSNAPSQSFQSRSTPAQSAPRRIGSADPTAVAGRLFTASHLASPADSTLSRLHAPLLRRDLKITSAVSCATSNCHGGPRPGVASPQARRGAEYQLWQERDPHADSWRTICGDESLQMMRRLGIMEENQIVDQAGFDNCLACHNTAQRFDEPRTTQTLREGVGCAACHGPAEKWIDKHFQQDWDPHTASRQGFVGAGDLYTRARMCASCHVGDQDRDMNHDIIAAGHPALRYELATFHTQQPKHWRDELANDADVYESQLWLAGQVAATDASLALLGTRASNAHTVSRWPEFAAYNCASCHHNLGLENDRDAIDSVRKASAIYSQWNDVGLRWLLDYRLQTGQATAEDQQLIDSLEAVRQAMEAKPRPDSKAVAETARLARENLAAWFDGTSGVEERQHFN